MENEIKIFENQNVKLEVNMKDETVWLNAGQYAVQEFLQILFVDFAKFQPDSLTKFLFDKKSFPKQEAWKICPFAA